MTGFSAFSSTSARPDLRPAALHHRLYLLQGPALCHLAVPQHPAQLHQGHHRHPAQYPQHSLSRGGHLIITLPLGVGAAIYLTEYARNRRLVAAIEFATETLTGIPSIIFGLVGMLFFCQLLGLQASLLAGSLTLVIVTIPTIIRTTQESLKTVPQSFREAALGLGAGKWHMIRTVVLPSSVDGIVTGCILAIGRIVGESAALLFTAGMGMSLNNFFGSVGNFIHSSGAPSPWPCMCTPVSGLSSTLPLPSRPF